MSKEIIRFKGLSFNRDEQSAGHGELSLCAGVELHDGTLRPSVLTGTEIAHGIGSTLLYVHETPSYRHFIGEFGSSLYWYGDDGTKGSQKAIHTFTGETIIKVESVGNTLMVLTESGIHYILWKDSDYKYLGNQIPFVEIRFRPGAQHEASFDLTTITDKYSEKTVSTAFRKLEADPGDVFELNTGDDGTHSPGEKATVKSDYRSAVTEGVWALINQSNNTVAKDGHFYAPFLIRYCYRLYDGSMVMHSAPLYMNVSNPKTYRVYVTNILKLFSEFDSYDGGVTGETTYYDRTRQMEFITEDFTIVSESGESYGTSQTVLFYIPNNVGIEFSLPRADAAKLSSLKRDWSDIVKSVDIFVSPMLTREKSGELITSLTTEEGNISGVRSWFHVYYTSPWKTDRGNTELGHSQMRRYLSNTMFDIPLLSEQEYKEKVKDCSTFYLLKSIKLDGDATLKTDGQYYTLDYDKAVVPIITTQEEMLDDYHTHCRLLPMPTDRGTYVYNHRLNLYGMKEQLFEGFSMGMMSHGTAYAGSDGWRYDTIEHYLPDYLVDSIFVKLNTDDGTKYVKKTVEGWRLTAPALGGALLFYPDSRATEMVIVLHTGSSDEYPKKAIVVKLEPHNFLNGAVGTELFYADTWDDVTLTDPQSYTLDDEVPMANKVITSKEDNPYYFPLEGRNTVGVGSVKGIAAVTRALSQGQVGDHDLVVFSTDGIWVMKVSSTGTYLSTHNISREVCSNVRSICQLDQSIVFATQRSLSRFVESDVTSISDILDGPIPVWSKVLPTLTQYFATNGDMTKFLAFGTPAIDMFNTGRVFYDYASLRLIVLQEDTSKESVALVFSIRDQAWSTMKVPGIKAVVPGYPSPYVQKADGRVMVLDKQYDYSGDGRLEGLVITRTLTFSDTMDVLRGFRQLTDCEDMPLMFFFGSNDQRSWKPIGQTARAFYEYLPGHPYRFFRIAIYMRMRPSEEYQQLELEVINKYAKL